MSAWRACGSALVAMAVMACTAPTIENDVDQGKPASGSKSGGGSGASSSGADDPGGDTGAGGDPNDPSQTPAGNGDPSKPPANAPDGDKDGVPDATDCDPANAAVVGTKLFDEPLANETTSFAPSLGFSAGSWSFDATSYRQTRLADAADATFFTKDVSIEDVDVQVSSASTEISSAITPTLRQLMIVFGARMEGTAFVAYGCGAEVVEGLSPTQRTSLVKLGGTPSAVTTSALVRNERGVLQANEAFSMRLVLKGGKATCSVMQGANGATVTTAEANIADAKGALGFFTRQTKALFKNAKACKLVK